METMKEKILDWLIDGDVGLSSKTMALTAIGKKTEIHHPLDPADLNRCIKLVDAVPQILEHFDEIAKLSNEWATVIQNWGILRNMFISEAGYNWSKKVPARDTYDYMGSLGL